MLVSCVAGAETPPAPTPAPLENIVINADKLSVESRIDRKIYSVNQDAQSTFGSLSDILSVIPSVDVDPDGIVSLRGDTNVLILIDGKPSTQFQGSAAGDNLQSIPAADIERIEILTTPPPQFKADGAAGVINIITRTRHARGTTGSMHGSLGNDKRSVVGANGSYAGKRLTASVTAGYREDYRQRVVQSQVNGTDPNTGELLSSNDHINEHIRRNAPNVALSSEYSLNERQSVTGSASWSGRGGLRTYTQLDDSTLPSGAVTSSTRRLSSGHDPENNYDASLRFTQKLAQPGETLDASLHRSISHQFEHYDYSNDSFVPPEATFYNNLSFHEDHTISEGSLDYVRTLFGSGSLKLGYSFEQDDYGFANIGANIDPSSGDEIIDPALTNDFTFRQSIHSLYQSYQASAGPWTWLGGLRTEITHTDARLLSSDLSTPSRYVRLYPSLHLDRSLSEQATLSFGVSRRVQRPDPSNLNPYVDYEYTPNLRGGNANLKPQFAQSFDVGYEYEGGGTTFNLTGYYRHNTDTVTDVTEYLGNGLSLTTKANLPKNDAAGVEFVASGHLLRSLAYTLSGNAFYTEIDARALGAPGLKSTEGINLKAKLDWHPSAADSAQVTFTRTDKRLTPQGSLSAINLVNLGYKRALGAHLAALATIADVFNGNRYRRFTSTPLFTQVYERSTTGRVIYIGLVYAFGSAKKEKQPGFEYDPES